MAKKVAKTFNKALRAIRKEQGVSLLDLGLRIESDASHISKIEGGQDIALSTLLRLAEALEVSVTFGGYEISMTPAMKERTRKKTARRV